MEWVTMIGDTVEEARERALDTLGVHDSEADVEILEEPKKGLFGRVKSPARVRARVRPKPQAGKQAQPRRRRQRGGEGGSAAEAGTSQGGGRSASQRSNGGQSKGGQGNGRTAGGRGESGGARTSAGTNATGAVRSGSGGGKGERPSPATPSEPIATGLASTGTGAPESALTDTKRSAPAVDPTDALSNVMQGVLRAMGLTGTVEVGVSEQRIDVVVNGDGCSVLVGHGGSTATALEELLRTAQPRSEGEGSLPVRLDVNGYQDLRRDALVAFTHEVAAATAADGVSRRLNPMRSGDRKLVHDEATNLDGVRTESEGMESQRRVVILPA